MMECNQKQNIIDKYYKFMAAGSGHVGIREGVAVCHRAGGDARHDRNVQGGVTQIEVWTGDHDDADAGGDNNDQDLHKEEEHDVCDLVHEGLDRAVHGDMIPEQTDEKINVNSDKDSCILPPIDTADYDEEDSANEMTSSFRSALTLTSINTDGLNQILHSYKHVDRKGRLYKCDVCKKITRTFDDASQHFMLKHQNCESERKKIEDAMNARQKCLTKISSIKEDVKRGCNEAMAMSQLNLVTQELTKNLNLLCDFDRAKRLPEGLSRKTKELCRALDETIKEVDIIVKQSENKMLK
jgi:hypothetical protein